MDETRKRYAFFERLQVNNCLTQNDASLMEIYATEFINKNKTKADLQSKIYEHLSKCVSTNFVFDNVKNIFYVAVLAKLEEMEMNNDTKIYCEIKRGGGDDVDITYNKLLCALNTSAINFINSFDQVDNPLYKLAIVLCKNIQNDFNFYVDDVKTYINNLLCSKRKFLKLYDDSFITHLSQKTFLQRMKHILFNVIPKKIIKYEDPIHFTRVKFITDDLLFFVDNILKYSINNGEHTFVHGFTTTFHISNIINQIVKKRWNEYRNPAGQISYKQPLVCNGDIHHGLPHLALFKTFDENKILKVFSINSYCWCEPEHLTKEDCDMIKDENNIILYPDLISYDDVDVVYYTYVPSNDLNNSILNWLLESENLDEVNLNKTKIILNYFIDIQSNLEDSQTNSFYVYHGTNQIISDKTFTTFSFLSTTTDYNVALDYAGDDGVVYVLKLNYSIPFIKFNDELSQIIIPMGTTFVQQTIDNDEGNNKQNVTILLYDAVSCENLSNILNKISIKNNNYILEHDQDMFQNIIEDNLKHKNITYGSSIILTNELGNKIYKNVRKEHGIHKLSFNQMFLRYLNEMLAAYIYQLLFDIKTLDYSLVWYSKAKMFLLESNYDSSIQTIETIQNDPDYLTQYNKYMSNEILIDMVMSNWDAYNNCNSIYKSGSRFTFRVDVGGALYYRGKGDRNILFGSSTPNDIDTFKKNKHFLNLLNQKDLQIQNFIKPLLKAKDRLDLFKTIINTKKVIKTQRSQLDTIPRPTILPPIGLPIITQNPFDFISQIQNDTHREYYFNFLLSILNTFENRLDYYIKNGEGIIKTLIGGQNGGQPEPVSTPLKIDSLPKTNVNLFGNPDLFRKLIDLK